MLWVCKQSYGSFYLGFKKGGEGGVVRVTRVVIEVCGGSLRVLW